MNQTITTCRTCEYQQRTDGGDRCPVGHDICMIDVLEDYRSYLGTPQTKAGDTKETSRQIATTDLPQGRGQGEIETKSKT